MRDARLVRHLGDGDRGLVAVEGDAGNDGGFHVRVLLADQRARARARSSTARAASCRGARRIRPSAGAARASPAPRARASPRSSPCGSRRASGTMRGSVVYTPSTSVRIWHSSAPSTTASATAVVSEPPRPIVVMSPFAARPWKPATTGTTPAARSLLEAVAADALDARAARGPGRLDRQLQRVPGARAAAGTCTAPSRAARSRPSRRSRAARPSRARSGSGHTSRASSIRRSVESPIAETTTATWWPCLASARTCAATAWMRATEPTEVPPYFWTMQHARRLFQVSAGIGRAVADFRRSMEKSAETSARLGRRPISSLYVRS